jgi:hypothetical protein
VEEKEPLSTVGGTINLYNHYGKQYESSSKSKNRPIIQFRNTTPGHVPKGI